MLYRHVSKYCPNIPSEPGTSQHKRSRIRMACFPCRDKKLKCNGKQPCDTCQSKGYDCHYQKQDAGQEVQQGTALAPVQQSISVGPTSSDIPGGLATPASVRGNTAVNIIPEESTHDLMREQYPISQADTWNFDWIRDMEMNDFSVLCP